MSADLDDLIDSLRADAHGPAALAPDRLRKEGDRRNRSRRIAVATATAGAVAAAVVAAVLVWPSEMTDRPVPAGPLPSTTAPLVVPTLSTGPSATGTHSAPPPAVASTPQHTGVAACQTGDLDPRPAYGYQGAASNSYMRIIVKDQENHACRLGGKPELLYTNAAGTILKLPVWMAAGTNIAAYTVKPGAWADFSIDTANGRPLGSECGAPISYHGLYLLLPSGQRYPLPAAVINVTCPGTHPTLGVRLMGGWSTSKYPTPEDPTMTRAPAP